MAITASQGQDIRAMRNSAAAGGSPIHQSELRLGDYIRFDGAPYSFSAQWWRVLEMDDFQIILMNETYTTRVITRDGEPFMRRVLIHPYSLKHSGRS